MPAASAPKPVPNRVTATASQNAARWRRNVRGNVPASQRQGKRQVEPPRAAGLRMDLGIGAGDERAEGAAQFAFGGKRVQAREIAGGALVEVMQALGCGEVQAAAAGGTVVFEGVEAGFEFVPIAAFGGDKAFEVDDHGKLIRNAKCKMQNAKVQKGATCRRRTKAESLYVSGLLHNGILHFALMFEITHEKAFSSLAALGALALLLPLVSGRPPAVRSYDLPLKDIDGKAGLAPSRSRGK